MSHDLLHIGIPVAEKVIRTVAVYGALAVLLRLAGKRDLAQLNTFDLVVMLLLSNVVQNAVIGNDNSLTGGLLGAAVLVAVNAVVVRAAVRSDRGVRLFEGTDTVLIDDGEFVTSALHREGLREADVDVAVRRQGATDVTEVEKATLAPGGSVVVALKPEAMPATKADVASIAAAIRRLELRLEEGSRG
jgi:uncharacterized membrane protein YcaP (DUF421 family)